MLRAFLLFLLLVSWTCFSSEISKDVRCFTSTDGRVNLKLALLTDNKWMGGYIIYKNSSSAITIVPIKSECETLDVDRPSETTTTWLAVINGGVAGKFKAVHQGAIFSYLNYSNAKNENVMNFIQNDDAFDGNDCIWK
ncbi:hypothetical protein [Sodalis sp. RH16]|jgi:hypothetical protein|uniref:hypothetical protein n=1 Tax=Sodalis sp. RH16 TaxID=3394331 RepID=UPI0039B4F117